MATRYIRKETGIGNDAAGTALLIDQPTAVPLVFDTADNKFKFNAGGTIRSLGDSGMIVYSADGAIGIFSHTALLTKGSAAAMTVAAPGANWASGIRISIVSGSAFAHVITFTGGTLWDGTTGANTTVTMTAFIGSSITFIATSATTWAVESQNTLTSIA